MAALDYLGNVSGRLDSIGLIAEADFAELASLALRDGMTGLGRLPDVLSEAANQLDRRSRHVGRRSRKATI